MGVLCRSIDGYVFTTVVQITVSLYLFRDNLTFVSSAKPSNVNSVEFLMSLM